jgi:methylenetetrahydrofolate reductase (NADPH)
MTINELASQKSFIVTSELTPPKGANCEGALKAAEAMSQYVDAINVTDGQSAVMRMGSLALCRLLMDRGIEPVFQLTCRDRNRIALQSELLNAFGLGIRNVLCLTGDHVSLGDHPDAKQVFDLDSVSLLWAAQKLNAGLDMRGNTLNGATSLCVGAAVNPNASPVEPQLLKMERKIKTGARFFQTQGVFEVSKIKPFAQLAQAMKVPLLIGVLLLRTPAMATFVNEHVSGIHVPENIIAELESSKDPTQSGIEIAARIITEAKDVCQGAHIMTGGREELVKEILDMVGILHRPPQKDETKR